MSIGVLGIISRLPWVTKWLDEFVHFVSLGLAAVNIANVIMDPRIKSGSTSRNLMFRIVSFQDISTIKKQRAVLMVCKNNEPSSNPWPRDLLR